MNVYSCWYQGIFGYGCRTRRRKWMFVPELGQPDNKIYKNLNLDDLIFKNPFDKIIELDIDKRLSKFSLLKIIKGLIIPTPKSLTVGGLLFTVN